MLTAAELHIGADGWVAHARSGSLNVNVRRPNGSSMSDITQARRAIVARILEGDGKASRAQRRAAFDNAVLAEPLRTLIDKVAKYPSTVADDEIAAAKTSDFSEDQIFELVVCAAIGHPAVRHGTRRPQGRHRDE